MKGCIGVIGGSGVYEIEGLRDARWTRVETPWGVPSDAILTGWPGNAILTAPDRRAPELVAKLDAVAGRVL